MKKTIWILEDEPEILFVYKECLGPEYCVRTFETISEFNQALADSQNVNLLIADLKLPDGYFLDQLSALSFPVMVVSSLDDIETLRAAYERGAMDYVIKPFRKSELIAKTEAALSKARPHSTPEIMRELTKKEEQILTILLASFNPPVPRSKITQSIWGNTQVGDKTLDVHLVNLRKKLSDTNFAIESAKLGSLQLVEKREHP